MDTQVVTLRTATAADIGEIDALLSQSYVKLLKGHYPPSVQVTAIPIISRANPSLITSGAYYVAVDRDDRILGAGGWSRSVKGPTVGDVRHVVTHHLHTRRGIGRRLLMGIVSEARHAGIRRLDCLSTRAAVPFYGAVGFERQLDVTIGLRPGIEFPAVRMMRRL